MCEGFDFDVRNVNTPVNIDVDNVPAIYAETPVMLPGERLQQLAQSIAADGFTTNISELLDEFNNTFGDWATDRQRTREMMAEIEALNNDAEYADNCDPPDLSDVLDEAGLLDIEPLDE